MKHTLEHTIYYADTDSYGVVWHGTYLRFMEQARVEFCRQIGLDLLEMKANDIVIPVTNLNIRYKASAKLDDKVITETEITKITPITVVFKQVIKDKKTEKIYTTAEVEVVCINNEGKLYHRIPDILKTKCEKAMAN